jgi:hypothetical protein
MIDDFRLGEVGLAEQKRKQAMEERHQNKDKKEEEKQEGFFSRLFSGNNEKTRTRNA